MINPMKLMQIKNMMTRLRDNHPKFPAFIQAVSQRAIYADTVIEITVTTPNGERLESNLKLKESDIEVLRELQNLQV